MAKQSGKTIFQPSFPFNPAKWPFFYGWVILIVGAFGVLMSIPGQTTGISAFTNHLIENYRLERVWFATSYFIGTTCSGFSIRYVGRVYDKIGARPVAIAAAIVLSITLLLLSQLDRIVLSLSPMFGSQYNIILLFILLTPLIFLLRLSGQGVTTLISRNMVMKWFEARRGFVNIFLGVIIAVSFNATPKVFDELIQFSSWREAWVYMAIFIASVYILIIVIFYRDNPQDSGLLPDGSTQTDRKKEKRKLFISNGDFTLEQARKKREFWLYTSSLSLLGLFFTGFSLNYESVFASQGLSKELALQIFLFSGLISIIFQISGNFISDFVSLRYFLPFATFFTTLNIIAIVFVQDGNFFYYLLIACLGINAAFFGIFSAITWPRLFGTKHLGEISGYSIGFVVISSAVGPLLMALSFYIFDSYFPALYLCAVFGILLFILSFTARDERTLKT